MPILTKPEISPTINLTDRFNDMFGKYLTPIYELDITDAEERLQEQFLDELREELETCNLITHDSPLEVDLNYDNLIEWLGMYYRLEKK